MRFVPVGPEERQHMLETVGAESVDGLFDIIPDEIRLRGALSIPDGLSEMRLWEHLTELASTNLPATEFVSFMGAGCYDSYVPAIVDHVLRKPSFFTAYTPYQPEISQGTLQATFEFQSLICRLTGMEVANASMYDGASAIAEAALLATRATGRKRVLVASSMHPEWIATLRTYAEANDSLVVEVFSSEGALTDVATLEHAAADAAAVLVSDPDFHGCLHDLPALTRAAHSAGALMVVSTDLSLLGVLEGPGAYGVDIVVGEGQPIGSAMSFGGPGFGFFATTSAHLRRMPGRIVGRTTDTEGTPGFVLTMQTREQHIRRGKATSNICSNHALSALAACVHLVALCSEGLREIGRRAVAGAHYLHDGLISTGRFERIFDAPFAREFSLRFDGDVGEMQLALAESGYLAGVDLGPFGHPGGVLFAVTERRTRSQIDAFVEEVAAL